MEQPDTAAETSDQGNRNEGAALPIASFSNSFARLPERFFVRQYPTPVARPSW